MDDYVAYNWFAAAEMLANVGQLEGSNYDMHYDGQLISPISFVDLPFTTHIDIPLNNPATESGDQLGDILAVDVTSFVTNEDWALLNSVFVDMNSAATTNEQPIQPSAFISASTTFSSVTAFESVGLADPSRNAYNFFAVFSKHTFFDGKSFKLNAVEDTSFYPHIAINILTRKQEEWLSIRLSLAEYLSALSYIRGPQFYKDRETFMSELKQIRQSLPEKRKLENQIVRREPRSWIPRVVFGHSGSVIGHFYHVNLCTKFRVFRTSGLSEGACQVQILESDFSILQKMDLSSHVQQLVMLQQPFISGEYSYIS